MTTPEDRRFFVKVLGRVEFEVDAGEYIRTFQAAFKWPQESDDDHLPNLTFNSSVLQGWYVDPKKEEVLADGDRP